MAGRYGVDELSRLMLWVVLALFVLSMIFRWGIFSIIAYALIIYMYFRIFSKNIAKRREENLRYLDFRYNAGKKVRAKKERFAQRKYYRFFSCPTCGQTVRVPKGHGKICITCPKCRGEFIKKV